MIFFWRIINSILFNSIFNPIQHFTLRFEKHFCYSKINIACIQLSMVCPIYLYLHNFTIFILPNYPIYTQTNLLKLYQEDLFTEYPKSALNIYKFSETLRYIFAILKLEKLLIKY